MKRSICVLSLSGNRGVISKNKGRNMLLLDCWSRNRLRNRKAQGQKSGKIIQHKLNAWIPLSGFFTPKNLPVFFRFIG